MDATDKETLRQFLESPESKNVKELYRKRTEIKPPNNAKVCLYVLIASLIVYRIVHIL